MIPVNDKPLPNSGNLAFGADRVTHMHNGIDIPAAEGTAVLAARAGVVRHASMVYEQGFAGYGAHVVIEHPGSQYTLYAHLSRVDVQVGEPVQEGEVIGAVGRTAFSHEDHESMVSTGPHLHFEVSPNPYPQGNQEPRINPIAWLSGLSRTPSSQGVRAAVTPFPIPDWAHSSSPPVSSPPRQSLPSQPGEPEQCAVARYSRCQLDVGHVGPHDYGEVTEPRGAT